jgi:hypothetical protein
MDNAKKEQQPLTELSEAPNKNDNTSKENEPASREILRPPDDLMLLPIYEKRYPSRMRRTINPTPNNNTENQNSDKENEAKSKNKNSTDEHPATKWQVLFPVADPGTPKQTHLSSLVPLSPLTKAPTSVNPSRVPLQNAARSTVNGQAEKQKLLSNTNKKTNNPQEEEMDKENQSHANGRNKPQATPKKKAKKQPQQKKRTQKKVKPALAVEDDNEMNDDDDEKAAAAETEEAAEMARSGEATVDTIVKKKSTKKSKSFSTPKSKKKKLVNDDEYDDKPLTPKKKKKTEPEEEEEEDPDLEDEDEDEVVKINKWLLSSRSRTAATCEYRDKTCHQPFYCVRASTSLIDPNLLVPFFRSVCFVCLSKTLLFASVSSFRLSHLSCSLHSFLLFVLFVLLCCQPHGQLVFSG